MRRLNPEGWPAAVCFAAFAAGYAVLAAVSVAIAGVDGHFAALWVSNVAAFAIMVRNPYLFRPAALAGVFAGCMAGNLLKGSDAFSAALFSMVAVIYVAALVRATSVLLTSTDASGHGVRRNALALVAVCAVTVAMALVFAFVARMALGWPVSKTAMDWGLTNIMGAAVLLPAATTISRERLRHLATGWNVVRLVAWTFVCSAGAILTLANGTFLYGFAMIPLLVATARLPIFDLSLLLAFVGMSSVLATTDAPFLGGGLQAHLFHHSDEFALVLNLLMPFLAGVLLDQITASSQRLAATKERYRRAVYESPAGFTNVDLSGRIIDANPAFARMLGYSVEEIEGRYVKEFTPEDDLHIGESVMAAAKERAISEARFQKRYLRRDGTPFWVEISASLVENAAGGAPCLVSQVVDIDARKKAEAKLAEMEDRWDFALASVGQGFWDHNVDAGSVTYSTTWTGMLGYTPGELDGDANSWLGNIHPDDLPAVKAMDEAHQAGRIPAFELEYRMRHKSGNWIWVLDRGKVIERDDEGRPVRLIGTLTNISNRKQVEDDLEHTATLLADEKERLRVTLNSIGDGVICTDANDLISFVNPVAEALTGIAAADAIGMPLRDIYHTTEEEVKADVSKAKPGDQFRLPWQAMTLMRQDGSQRSIREVVSPIRSEKGDPAGLVIVFQDFTDMRTMQRELQRAATHDGLTGLANRVSFLGLLDRLFVRARADSSQHQVLFIDLDRFKLVNDSGGHAAGDALLKAVAEVIRGTVRADDMVARLGGDEFAVVLQGCPMSFARLVAQNIVDSVRAFTFEWDSKTYTVGASVGLATIDASSGSVETVIQRADRACYAAKAAGRGMVWVSELDGENVIDLTLKPRIAS